MKVNKRKAKSTLPLILLFILDTFGPTSLDLAPNNLKLNLIKIFQFS